MKRMKDMKDNVIRGLQARNGTIAQINPYTNCLEFSGDRGWPMTEFDELLDHIQVEIAPDLITFENDFEFRVSYGNFPSLEGDDKYQICMKSSEQMAEEARKRQ